MSDTFLRYLAILQEIPTGNRRVGSAILAERLEQRGFHVTRRTVQRDLEKLSRMLPLVCCDKTKPYGWSWEAGATPLVVPSTREPGSTATNETLATLDRWYELPGRAFVSGLAPFLAPHLGRALGSRLGLELRDASVIPLDPELVDDHGEGEEHGGARDHVDFLVVGPDGRTPVLARLTATNQDGAGSTGLTRLARSGLRALVERMHHRAAASPDGELTTHARRLGRLAEQGLVSSLPLRTCVIQPEGSTRDGVMSYAELAQSLATSGGAQCQTLAEHLRDWSARASRPLERGPAASVKARMLEPASTSQAEVIALEPRRRAR